MIRYRQTGARLLRRLAQELYSPPAPTPAPPPASLYERKREEIGKPRTLDLDGRGRVYLGRWTYHGAHTRFESFAAHEVLAIGNFCSLSDSAHFLLSDDHHHPQRVASFPVDKFFHHPIPEAGQAKYTRLGSDVWVGAHVTLQAGVRIGDGAVLAAGSVVTKDVPPFTVVGGNPAKPLRPRFEDEALARALHECVWWEWTDADLLARAEFFNQPADVALALADKQGWRVGAGLPVSYMAEIPPLFGAEQTAESLSERTRAFLNMDDNADLIHRYKTLSYENIAVWLAFLESQRPACLVELGTMYGASALLLARLCRWLDVPTRLISVDIRDNLAHRDPDVEYILEDFTGHMTDLWTRWQPDAIFQDTHMYPLIKEQIEVGKAHPHTWHLFHDVGRRVYKTPMSIPTSAKPTSATGSWERHVLGEYAPPILAVPTRHYEDERLQVHLFDSIGDYRELGLGVLKWKN